MIGKRIAAVAATVLFLVVMSGCGVALVEDPQPLPLKLPPATTISSGIINEENPTVNVYFVNAGRLRAVPRPLLVDGRGTGGADVIEKAVRELLAGPTPEETKLGFISQMEAIAPKGSPKPIVARVSRGQVFIDLATDLTGPTGDNVNMALGQLVYTVINATSGIGSVVLTNNGSIVAGIRTEAGVSQGDLYLEDFQCIASSQPVTCSSTNLNRALLTTRFAIEGDWPIEITGYYLTIRCSVATPAEELVQFSAVGGPPDPQPILAVGEDNTCQFMVESLVGADITNFPDAKVRLEVGSNSSEFLLGDQSPSIPIAGATDLNFTVRWPASPTDVTTTTTTVQ